MDNLDDIISAQIQEIHRGTVVLACLLLLDRPRYGYSLLSTLEENGFPVEGNTLYPLLRRLEKQGLLVSEWSVEEARPRKYYRVSEAGRTVAAELSRQWQQLSAGLNRLRSLREEGGTNGGTNELDR